jgi:hypothetical protein
VGYRKGLEVEMSKRRKNQFREALNAKREALTRAANEPKPEKQPGPEWEPGPPSFAPRSWQTVSQSERPSSQKSRVAGVAGVDKEE